MARSESIEREVAGFPVTITNPGKVFFEEARLTKLDLVEYYLSVAEGALRGVRDRPMALKRFVNGASGEFFFQKRAPDKLPEFVRTAPERFRKLGDPSEGIDEQAHSLEPLLELSRQQEEQGLGDAPWPPMYEKQEGEPSRVQPSRKKKTRD